MVQKLGNNIDITYDYYKIYIKLNCNDGICNSYRKGLYVLVKMYICIMIVHAEEK